ncbi:hypothetical protein OG21DRAFT_463833 [Imleria badia]|nr:hypothetical protein OG21DRAFT_463833 [Imleria badia]
MCHRQLKLVKHTECGHNSFVGDSLIDCRTDSCIHSAAHPPTCHSPPCTCRRYYEQPQRIITHLENVQNAHNDPHPVLIIPLSICT